MTKKEIVTKLTDAGIEFDETLSAKELESEFSEILSKNLEESDESEEQSSSNGAIHFKIRNQNMRSGFSIRTFSKELNGEEYKSLATEFEEANTHKKPSDVKDQVEVKQVIAYNSQIKHPIISKSTE